VSRPVVTSVTNVHNLSRPPSARRSESAHKAEHGMLDVLLSESTPRSLRPGTPCGASGSRRFCMLLGGGPGVQLE